MKDTVKVNLYKNKKLVCEIEDIEYKVHLLELSHPWFKEKDSPQLDGEFVFALKFPKKKEYGILDKENSIELKFDLVKYIFKECRFSEKEGFIYGISERLIGPIKIFKHTIERELGEFNELEYLGNQVFLLDGWIKNPLPDKNIKVTIDDLDYLTNKIIYLEITKLEESRIYFKRMVLECKH